jgi:glucosamine-6-phosphate deaminase
MRAPGPPRITVFSDVEAMAAALANRISDALAANPSLVLGLPTGRTPIRFYDNLVRLANAGRADFSRATTFNLDEFLGIGPDHPGSFRHFMNTHLFSRVDISSDRIHFLSGMAPDPEAECERYEREIAAAGGVDIQILGIGTNGHIGFNEPAPTLVAKTHRVTLTDETRESNAGLFGGNPARVPLEALSMGMATILHARSIVLLASGEEKASIVKRVLEGPVTTDVPASFLQLHPDVEILLDQVAAGLR